MRLRSRLYRLSWGVARHLPAVARIAHGRLWLALLGPADHDDLTIHGYSAAAGAGFGFGSESHNDAGLWPWEKEAFACLADCRAILVAGAGGGREMIALARDGLTVSGFDASPDLVAAARANLRAAGVEGALDWAPPGQVPHGGPDFDGLVIGRGCYHHIAGRARRIAFLAACRERLLPGAPMVLGDVLTRPDDRRGSRFGRTLAIEPGDSVSDSFYHRFTRAELTAELHEAGFVGIDYRIVPGKGALAQIVARTNLMRPDSPPRP